MKKSVLLIAYACEPGGTSEPGVGWNLACQIAKNYRVTVLTRANNKEVIESFPEVSEGPGVMPGIRFAYTDLPQVFMKLKKRMLFGTQFYYLAWQWKALSVCRKLHKTNAFDIVHHVTFGVSWLAPPSVFVDAPFVWGPIGGGDLVPGFIMKRESIASRTKELIYRLLVLAAYHLSPLARITRRRSRAILFRNRSTERNFPPTDPGRRHVICETATESIIVSRTNQGEGGLRAICVGRMQYWKGFRYAVEGFHRYLDKGGCGTLILLGDGSEMPAIRRYIKDNSIEGQVEIMGQVPANEVPGYLDAANVLIHPSFRDGGSWAVLEGMTRGLPVIAVDYSGSADMVTADCGFCLRPRNTGELIENIADVLLRLEHEPELRRTLGVGAQHRVEEGYRWSVRGESMCRVYQGIID